MASRTSTSGYSVGERARQGVARALEQQRAAQRTRSVPQRSPRDSISSSAAGGGSTCRCLVGQVCHQRAGHGEALPEVERLAALSSRSCGCTGQVCKCKRLRGVSETRLIPGELDVSRKMAFARSSVRPDPDQCPKRFRANKDLNVVAAPPSSADLASMDTDADGRQPAVVAQSPSFPSLADVCSAPWESMPTIPPRFVADWAEIFCSELRSFNAYPSEHTLARVMLMSKAVLAAPAHGGRQRASTSERLVATRLSMWRDGKEAELWHNVQAAWNRKPRKYRNSSENKEAVMRRARMFADIGLPGKACLLLCSRGIADPAEAVESIKQLFPAGEGNMSPPATEDCDIDDAQVLPVLRSLKRGLSAGPSGLRYDHLLQVFSRRSPKHPVSDDLLRVITSFVGCAVGGRIPAEIARWLCTGRVVPCCKKDGGLRPVVVGEVLRAVVSRFVLRVSAEAAQELMPDYQLGFSPNRSGMQAGVFIAQHWASKLGDRYLLKVDVKNAFNSISRKACVSGAEKIHEHLAAWSRWILHTPSQLSCGSFAVECKAGVQQGEPLSPLLFCAGLWNVTEALGQSVPSVQQQWFLDDGLILGTAEELAAAIGVLEQGLQQISLTLNFRKCELYGESPPLHAGLQNIPFIQDKDLWSYLGSPIGSNPGKSPPAKAALQKIYAVSEAVDDFASAYPAQALKILRHCLGACRVNHLCQTCPTSLIREEVITPVAAALRSSLSRILGCPVTDNVWDQATRPTQHGGLGLHDPTDSAEAARMACLINCGKLLANLGLPADVYEAEVQLASTAFNNRLLVAVPRPEPDKNLQRSLTDHVHQQRLDKLISSAQGGEAERLKSLATPHATDWVTSVSPWFGLLPKEYKAALRWILAIPVRCAPYLCPDCGAQADARGLHAVTCKISGAAGRSHSLVKFLLANLYRAAMCTVEVEQGPDCSRKRPADILVRGCNPLPLALDVTIWTRLLASLDVLDAVVARKLAAGKAACEEEGWRLRVWAADTYGALHPSTRPMVNKLISMLKSQLPWKSPEQVSQEVWTAISAAVVSRAAVQLVRHSEKPVFLHFSECASSAVNVDEDAEPVDDLPHGGSDDLGSHTSQPVSQPFRVKVVDGPIHPATTVTEAVAAGMVENALPQQPEYTSAHMLLDQPSTGPSSYTAVDSLGTLRPLNGDDAGTNAMAEDGTSVGLCNGAHAPLFVHEPYATGANMGGQIAPRYLVWTDGQGCRVWAAAPPGPSSL